MMSNTSSLTMGMIELNVTSIKLCLSFYTTAIGLDVLHKSDSSITLGSNKIPNVRLIEQGDYSKPAANSAGLYHIALVYSTRASLANALDRMFKTYKHLYQGSADHLVSEAFYFADPEGNGIELYCDKPRSSWQYSSANKPVMGSVYLNGLNYIEEYADNKSENSHIRVGHIHLKVGNIAEAKKFYCDVLHFDEIMNIQTALFVSRDGYHHHIGLNTWESLGASARAANTLGLQSFELIIIDPALYSSILANLKDNKIAFDKLSHTQLALQDPWANKIIISHSA